jgi:hypothetical protein
VAADSRRIEFLARAIVNRLEDRGLVEFGDAEAGIQVVIRMLQDNFQVAELLEQEARQRVAAGARGRVNEGDVREEMRRLAAERKFIL